MSAVEIRQRVKKGQVCVCVGGGGVQDRARGVAHPSI